MRIIAACILALMLAGCSDVWSHRPDCLVGFADGSDCAPGTTAYNQAQARQQQAQAQSVSDDAQCQSYGAAPGSPSYIQCRMNLDNQRAQERAQTRAAVAGALAGRVMPPPTQNMNVTVTNCNANPALCVGR